MAIEPAGGQGAFAVRMAQRLVASCYRLGRPIADSAGSLVVYELDTTSASAARAAISATLRSCGVTDETATVLVAAWLRTGDYLLDAQRLPPADFIMGNPPYVRLEEIDKNVAALYRARYATMTGRADLYVAFYEAALGQLAPGGVCAFICADRWMLNQYGADLRRLVTDGYAVETVIEMHGAGAFEDEVLAYPAVTIIRRGRQGPAVIARAGAQVAIAPPSVLSTAIHDAHTGIAVGVLPPGLRAARVESWFTGADPWPCASPERLALLKYLERTFPPLERQETGCAGWLPQPLAQRRHDYPTEAA